MSSKMLGSFIERAGPAFELVCGRKAREAGERDTLCGALAADAA